MKIKEELNKKIPERIQNLPEYRLFLKWVKENEKDIKNLQDIKEVLEGQINEDQDFYDKESKTQTKGTKTRILRPTAKEINTLKKYKKLFLKHL